MTIDSSHIERFENEGYMIIPDYFDQQQLELMRRECQAGIDDIHLEMDKQGTDVLGITHRNLRYFIPHQTDRSKDLHDLTFSEHMADVCRATLGNEAYFFLDQYVVKAAEKGMSFSWHQDAGYIQHSKVKPYLTCWIPLDDVSIENGTIFILPFSRMGHREVIDHTRDEDSNDMVGYTGDDPGIPVEVKAGTLVAFSSHMFHRSTANETDLMRRAYLLQYTAEPIYTPDGDPHIKVEPFISDGKRVELQTTSL
jgi:ectoine hydroxylase-related dioxygenase (phytanoyl-CoA dioxygenase family)